jgi:hypothetical protein
MQSVRCRCGTLSTFLPCEDCQAAGWAKKNKLSVVRRGVCIGQMFRRHHCRIAGKWCLHVPGVDHARLFLQGRTPAVFVSEPYPGPDVARLLKWCSDNGLAFKVTDESWHGWGTLHIEIVRGGGDE